MQNKSEVIFLHNTWNYFEETGDIEAYLLYLEYKKLADGEYADDFNKKAEENERKDERSDSPGN